MAFTYFLQPSVPADTGESPSLGASRIRALKNALIERLTSWVSGMDSAGTESDIGIKHLPCIVQGSNPSTPTNKVNVFAKDINSKAELHVQDEDGDIVKLTEAGGIAINGTYIERTALNVYQSVKAGFIFGCLGSITISDDEAQTVNAFTISIPYGGGSAVVLAGKYYSVSGNVGDKYYYIAH